MKKDIEKIIFPDEIRKEYEDVQDRQRILGYVMERVNSGQKVVQIG